VSKPDELPHENECPECGEYTVMDYCPQCRTRLRGDRKVLRMPMDTVDHLRRGFEYRLRAIMPYCHDDADLMESVFEGGQNAAEGLV